MKLTWWGLFGQGCKGVTSHLTFFWRSRVLVEDARDVKSPHESYIARRMKLIWWRGAKVSRALL